MKRALFRRVLFVDEGPEGLDEVRRTFEPMRGAWELDYGADGEQAIALLEGEAYDVVVCELRCREMGGEELLEAVRERQPGAIRIVLTAETNLETAIRTIPIAHQFLAKPCPVEQLEETLSRACRLRQELRSPELLKHVGGLGALPSPPRVYQEIVAATTDPNVDLEDVAAIVEKDVAVYAKVLKIVNSSFLGLARPVHSLREAIGIIGLALLRRVVLSAEVFEGLRGESLPRGFDFEMEQRHSQLVASIARRLLPGKTAAEDAYMAGMLHDIGHLILASRKTSAYERVELVADRSTTSYDKLERMVAGFAHTDVGAYLLSIWGLPYPIVEAVQYHHNPSDLGSTTFDVVGAVHVADWLARTVQGTWRKGKARLDFPYVQACGVLDRIEGWRAIAEETHAAAAARSA